MLMLFFVSLTKTFQEMLNAPNNLVLTVMFFLYLRLETLEKLSERFYSGQDSRIV